MSGEAWGTHTPRTSIEMPWRSYHSKKAATRFLAGLSAENFVNNSYIHMCDQTCRPQVAATHALDNARHVYDLIHGSKPRRHRVHIDNAGGSGSTETQIEVRR